MTNAQLRAELFREINPLLDDESAIKEVLFFLRKFNVSNSDIPDSSKKQASVRLEDLRIPTKLRRKRGCIRLTEEDMKDEHIRYIVSK